MQTAVRDRIDDTLEQLDLLMDLAAELRYKELQILANQSFNMIERWKDREQRYSPPTPVRENCKAAFSGDGRYYPGSSIASQPPMERVCEPCERALLDANGRALQARFHAVVAANVPAQTVVTLLGYEMVARAEKARTMAHVLRQGHIPASDAAQMTADDWKQFHAGLKAKGILGAYSTVPSADTIAAILLEMRKFERIATAAAPRPTIAALGYAAIAPGIAVRVRRRTKAA